MRIIAQRQARLVEQDARMAEQEARIFEHDPRNVELERRLASSSRNSSQTPSTDRFDRPGPKWLPGRSGYKPGG